MMGTSRGRFMSQASSESQSNGKKKRWKASAHHPSDLKKRAQYALKKFKGGEKKKKTCRLDGESNGEARARNMPQKKKAEGDGSRARPKTQVLTSDCPRPRENNERGTSPRKSRPKKTKWMAPAAENARTFQFEPSRASGRKRGTQKTKETYRCRVEGERKSTKRGEVGCYISSRSGGECLFYPKKIQRKRRRWGEESS